ncbi:MAG: nitrous oxide reductase family maturation protein NosD, partial [Flavobacteriales bacterium]|nr:nitrous oxide reductase family maturation protein NosD [Flavobacteriales bacterium]
LLKDISHSIIEKNLFSDNTTGIYMEGTNDIRSSENDFVGNGYALRIQANCYDGEFNRNNFCFNSFDIATNGTRILNAFDGNYWDKYEGYDLNRDGVGDVPYHPVSLYSMVVERMPNAMMLYRSFVVSIMDKAERVMPAITPVDLSDKSPLMKATTW